MTAPHQRPWWITAEWLASTSVNNPLAREILHLDAELAERTRERDAARSQNSTHMANSLDWKNQRDAARAEVATLQEHLPTVERLTKDLAETEAEIDMAQGEAEQALGGPRESLLQSIRELREERDAAIRDRNEFAAREVERFADDLCGGSLMFDSYVAAAKHRAAELRSGDVPMRDNPQSIESVSAESLKAKLHWAAPSTASPTTGTPPEPRRVKLPTWFRTETDYVAPTIAKLLLALADAIESVEVR